MRVILLLMLVAGEATGQTVEAERPPELDWVGVSPLAGAKVEWAVSAQVGGGVEGEHEAGVASLGAELALSGPPGCRYVVAGGTVHAWRADGLEGAAAEQWIDLCLAHASGPNVVGPNLDVSHRLQWDVRPGLAARPATWRRPVTRETVRVDFNIGGDDADSGVWAEIFPVAVVVDWLSQEDGGTSRDQATVGFEFVAARCGPLGAKCITPKISADMLEIVGIYLYLTPGTVDALVAGHSLFKLTGLRLGARLKLDLDVRYGMGFIQRAPEVEGGEVTTYAEAWAPVGSIALRGDWWKVKIEQLLYPTFDVELALDDRLTAEARVGGIDLSGFVARTALYSRDGEISDWTAGAAARKNFALAKGVSLSLIAEAGRSYYATLADDARPTPEVAVRGLAVLRVGMTSGGPAYQPR